MMPDDAIIALPTICGFAEVDLAHRQMQRHRGCRIDRCAWKWVAYYTLVRHGRIVPQELSPRERAYRRGIDFPNDDAEHGLPRRQTPEITILEEVLDGLANLALLPTDRDNRCAVKGERPWMRGR
ncbi:hypothetical protein [Nocardia abscessus]|uniref:hypothetical protein n=1 Tax=Nocardia abscessus TaxID=120957 RepID=UPI00245632F1|nr:hypothetical protein [Nocardia abscessus]